MPGVPPTVIVLNIYIIWVKMTVKSKIYISVIICTRLGGTIVFFVIVLLYYWYEIVLPWGDESVT